MSARVAINGSFLVKPVTGTQRHAREVIRALQEDGIGDLVILAPGGYPADAYCGYRVIRDRLPWRRRHMWLWEQLRLPGLMRKAGARVLWSPTNTGPVSVRPHVVTMHDASVFADPSWFSLSLRTIYRLILRVLGRTAVNVLTDSEFSRVELIKHGVAPEHKILAVPCGVGDEFSDVAKASSENGDRGERFVFCVGSRDPRKNVHRLVQAWRTLEPGVKSGAKLLIAGGGGRMFAKEFIGELPEDVDLLGYVDDEELIDLYREAVIFVYPSLYEGFGLPPLEAMSCGTPVITSNVSSLPEVVGDAALLVDPYDPADIAAAMRRVLSEQKLREELRKKGLERSKAFTWRRTARLTWRVLQEAAEQT